MFGRGGTFASSSAQKGRFAMNKLLLTNIGMLATPVGKAAKSGAEQGNIQVLKDAWVLIEDGVIGDLYFVESEYAHDYAKFLWEWRQDPLRHGVIGGGCHAIDLLRWYAGDPEEVFAYGTHKLLQHVKPDDTVVSVLKFPNNVIGKVMVSISCKRPYTMRTLIYGTKGTIIVDNTSKNFTLYTLIDGDISVNPEPQIIPCELNNHNCYEEFCAFVEAIKDPSTLMMTADQGARTVAVGLAIVESSKTGKPVQPNYNF